MFQQPNEFDELGLKVQRAQQRLEQVEGVGVVDGIRVIVDAQNQLLSVTLADEDAVLAAYRAAVADKQPKVDEAMQELRSDARFEAVSTFADGNAALSEAHRMERQQRYQDEDDDYYEERNRRGWLER